MTDLTLQKWRQGLQSPGGWHQQGQPPRLTPQKHPCALPCWPPAAQAQCSASSTTLPNLHPAQPLLPCMQGATQCGQGPASCCHHSPAVLPVVYTHCGIAGVTLVRWGICLMPIYSRGAQPNLVIAFKDNNSGKMSLACTWLPGSTVTVTPGLA